MFIDKFNLLCKEKGVKPSIALDEIDMARSNLSKWKKWKEDGRNDKLPYDSNLLKIADYFGVPVEYFSEETEKSPMPNDIGEENILRMYRSLSIEEKGALYAYALSLKEKQKEGIENEGL